MRRNIGNSRGATLVWVLCLMLVIFIIGGSVISATSISSGVALRYREIKSSYYYSRALLDAIDGDITNMNGLLSQGGTFTRSEIDSDPWSRIAQSVYDVKFSNSGKNVRIVDPDLGIDISPLITRRGVDANINITLTDQTMTKLTDYIAPKQGNGSPGEEGYEPPQEETQERTVVTFNMIIELSTTINDEDYRVSVSYSFNGQTLGTPGGGSGSGVLNSGRYQYIGAW